MDRMQALWKKYREVFLYLVFGVLTTAVNYLVYLFCRTLLPDGAYRIAAANLAAWVLSVLFAYYTNRRFVFQSRTGAAAAARELVSFVLARVFSLALDLAFVYAVVYLLGWDDRLAKLVSNVIVIIVNYVLSKLVIFRKS